MVSYTFTYPPWGLPLNPVFSFGFLILLLISPLGFIPKPYVFLWFSFTFARMDQNVGQRYDFISLSSPHPFKFLRKIRDLGDFKGSEIELLESLTRKSLRFFGETKQEKTALGARPSRGSANDPGFDAFGR